MNVNGVLRNVLLLAACASAFKVATVPSTVPKPTVAAPPPVVAPEKILAGNLAAHEQKREFLKNSTSAAAPRASRGTLA